MAARKKTDREKILNTAFAIVKEKGIEALNMRTLAQRCGCSTQPIYLSFKGSAELKAEVYKMICKDFNDYIDAQIAKKEFPQYKAIGMGYIRYAVERTEFFKSLFMRPRREEADFEKDSFDKSTFVIMQNYGLYKEEALTLHAEMWIFVHGIATMFATGYLDWDMNTVSKMVSDIYLGQLERIKNGVDK